MSLRLLVVASAALAAVGCTTVHTTRPDQYERGLVVCLSGAGGMMGETDRLRDGLASGGVDRAIETFAWSQGEVLADQSDLRANRRKAAELARRVENYLAEHPGRPVHLVGVSAGTGLVVWALEELQPPHAVTGAVLISSSLDTHYDLTAALEKVQDRVYSFNSVADTVLSLGVTWAGTVDRSGGVAGGLVGFSPPDRASAKTKALYRERLAEFSWWPGDMVLGHLGDHLGATNPAFVRQRIAPLVLGRGAPAGRRRPAAPEPVQAPEAVAPEATGGSAGRGRSRFVQWRVAEKAPGPVRAGSGEAGAAAADPAAPVDNSAFLRGPEPLP